MRVRPADTMNSRSPCTTPFNTETTRNSTPRAPPRGARYLGARPLHLAARLHRARGVLAAHEADRLEAPVGAGPLGLGPLGHAAHPPAQEHPGAPPGHRN